MTIRLAFALLALGLAGCCSPDLKDPKPTGTPSDLMLTADPGTVTAADLEAAADRIEAHYWAHSQFSGVVWEPRRSAADLEHPDQFGSGGDSAIFTGFALAAFSFQAAATGTPQDLDNALTTLRGLWYVTHAAGPGVIARGAFPKAQAARWRYPQGWKRRIEEHPRFVGETDGFVPGPPLPDPLGADFPPSVYYTRGTKDQLTGIVFGLAVAWHLVPEAGATVKQAVANLAVHLQKHGWKIRDQKGENDTTADEVDGLLKLAFLALWRKTSGDPAVEEEYLATFEGADVADWFNGFNNYAQYYAHNLRATRAFTIWLLETDGERRAEMERYFRDYVWRHVEDHQNAYFAALRAVQTTGSVQVEAATQAQRSLASLSLRPIRSWPSPYGGQDHEPSLGAHLLGCASAWVLPPHLRKPTEYWTWAKPPWDVGSGAPNADKPPLDDDSGLSFLLPWWVGRYYGLW